jgi:low affinity Fe/Cu permease
MKNSIFGRFAKKISGYCGNPIAFVIAVTIVIIWSISGPFFDYSETWQLVINTSTTIITFLMVFIIQNTQNKDTAAMHIKLDELIRANDKAHNALMDLEEFHEKELEKIRQRYQVLADEARHHLRRGQIDDNKPEADEDFNLLNQSLDQEADA